MNKRKNFTINSSIKIAHLVLFFCVLLFGVSLYCITELNKINSQNEKNYENRIIPVANLTTMRHSLSHGILKNTFEVNISESGSKKALINIEDKEKLILKCWRVFKSKESNSFEKKLILKTDRAIDLSIQSIRLVKNEIKIKQKINLQKINETQLLPNIDNALLKLSALIKYEERCIKNIDRLNKQTSDKIKKNLTIAISISFILILALVLFVFSKTKSILVALDSSKKEIAKKDLRLQLFIEKSEDIILILDANANIIDANPAAYKLLEYSDKELIGLHISRLVDTEEEIRQQEYFLNEIRKTKIGITERNIVTKNGNQVFVEIRNYLQEDLGFIAIIRNITEQKKAEIAIKDSEKKYRYLFSKAPAFIIIWDIESLRILEVNDSVIQKYGYSEEEWSKMDMLDIRPAEDHTLLKDFAEKMKSKDELYESKNKWRHLTKNGLVLQMEISSHKIIYNGKNAILSLARNISEEQKTQSALKESKEQLALFIEHSPASLAMLDTNMKYIARSRRWITDYGLYGQDIIGKTHYEIFPEITDRWKEIHQKCLKGAIERCDEDYFIREDGRKEWLRWEIRPWHKSSGEVGGIIMLTEVITEHMKAKELYEYQFENSPDIILIINKFFKIESINRTIPGGRPVEDLIGRDCIEVLPEVSRKVISEALSRCFQTGDDQEVESLLGKLWTKSRFVAMISEEQVNHVMIFTTDITEKKNADDELKKSYYKLQALTENISDAIILINENSLVSYSSAAVERITNYTHGDIDYQNFTDFVYEEDLGLSLEKFEKAKNEPGISIPFQLRIKHKNSGIVWVEGSVINLLTDENIKSFIVNYRDITSRISSEEDLKSSFKIISDYRNAIDESSIVSITDTLGNITHVNKNFCAISNYSNTELINQNHRIIYSGYHSPAFFQDLWKTISSGKIWKNEIKNKRKDDTLFWVDTTIVPFLDENGKPTQYISIGYDITERKIAELEKQEINERTMAILEDKVLERTKELFNINLILKAHNQDISDSINYANNIQKAILPKVDDLSKMFAESFILWMPKDVVSGDFYWGHEDEKYKYVAVVDCTGHGVPGALMSIIANQTLNSVIIKNHHDEPSDILYKLHKSITKSLNQKDELVKDGMDIALVRFEKATLKITFAGAQRPIYYFDGKKMQEIPGNDKGIGGFSKLSEPAIYTPITLQTKIGDIIYLNSDGYYSQFGGLKGKKMLKRRFLELLEQNINLPMNIQKEMLNKFFLEWQGTEEQTDDVIVIGIKIE